MFWAKEGSSFKVVADYVTDSRRRALKASRGDGETYCSKSRQVTIDANSDSPIATAAKTGKELKVLDTSTLKRAALAKEFGINCIHFLPTGAGVLEFGIRESTFLTGPTLAASLKMLCEASGAGFAIFWRENAGKLVVAGDYVTPARAAALKAEGKTLSFAQASKGYALEASGNGPVATVIKTGEPLYIQDVATWDTMKRGELAVAYGVKSLCLIPVPGGVIEYGTSNEKSTADWTCMEDACEGTVPPGELAKAFVEESAVYTLFWKRRGSEFEVGASYVLQERAEALRLERGDEKTFASESALVTLPATGSGPVASAAASGRPITLESPATDPNFARSNLAAEFTIRCCEFVPCNGGVLEYGNSLLKL